MGAEPLDVALFWVIIVLVGSRAPILSLFLQHLGHCLIILTNRLISIQFTKSPQQSS